MNNDAELIRPEDCLLLMVDIQKVLFDKCLHHKLMKCRFISPASRLGSRREATWKIRSGGVHD